MAEADGMSEMTVLLKSHILTTIRKKKELLLHSAVAIGTSGAPPNPQD